MNKNEPEPSPAERGAAGLALDPAAADAMRRQLPAVAEQTVRAVLAEVPAYADALSDEMGASIERAVGTALAGFVQLAGHRRVADAGAPLQPVRAAAYELGRGEAREGRTLDGLLAAYRVGARVAWRELARIAVQQGLAAPAVARFAELVFAYIDELSAASVAGYADEHATSGRVRQGLLERLAQQLLAGAAPEALATAAERADWMAPTTLTAVLLPSAEVAGALAMLDQRTLVLSEDLGAVLLVPDAHGARRAAVLRVLDGRHAIVGPPRPWTAVQASHRRAVRAGELASASADGLRSVDTEARLGALILHADEEALADLRERALAPLAELRPAVRERLEATLRAWLLHQGRREAVAADLMVHPQTVRYRMTQLRDLFGERLQDPDAVLELVIALADSRIGDLRMEHEAGVRHAPDHRRQHRLHPEPRVQPGGGLVAGEDREREQLDAALAQVGVDGGDEAAAQTAAAVLAADAERLDLGHRLRRVELRPAAAAQPHHGVAAQPPRAVLGDVQDGAAGGKPALVERPAALPRAVVIAKPGDLAGQRGRRDRLVV